MATDVHQKFTQLNSLAADSADIDIITDLMKDILESLYYEFTQTAGQQKASCEQAYSRLYCTVSAHQSTIQDIRNPFYVSELSKQIGRDIAPVLRKTH